MGVVRLSLGQVVQQAGGHEQIEIEPMPHPVEAHGHAACRLGHPPRVIQHRRDDLELAQQREAFLHGGECLSASICQS